MRRFDLFPCRPGPASWEVGDYPKGQDDYPVAGVSWYEAAAYAEFVGKRLPTIYHWDRAAFTYASPEIVPLCNFTVPRTELVKETLAWLDLYLGPVTQ